MTSTHLDKCLGDGCLGRVALLPLLLYVLQQLPLQPLSRRRAAVAVKDGGVAKGLPRALDLIRLQVERT